MKLLRTPETQIKLSQARRLMDEALHILDDLGEVGDVCAHLDLAICRLENDLAVDTSGTGGTHELRTAVENDLLTSSARVAASPWELKPI